MRFVVFVSIALLAKFAVASNLENYAEASHSRLLAYTPNALRMPRFTCDLLSIKIKGIPVEDAACSLKCLSQLRPNGHCVDGVCICF